MGSYTVEKDARSREKLQSVTSNGNTEVAVRCIRNGFFERELHVVFYLFHTMPDWLTTCLSAYLTAYLAAYLVAAWLVGCTCLLFAFLCVRNNTQSWVAVPPFSRFPWMIFFFFFFDFIFSILFFSLLRGFSFHFVLLFFSFFLSRFSFPLSFYFALPFRFPLFLYFFFFLAFVFLCFFPFSRAD